MTENNKNSYKDQIPKWQSAADGLAIIATCDDAPCLTVMPLSKAIISLAGPAMTSMLLMMIFNLVDIWWVGKLGPEHLAGVSAAAFIFWALQSVGTLVSTGVTAMVARYVGEKDIPAAKQTASQGILLAVGLAITFSLGGIVFADQTFKMMGLEQTVWQAAMDYQRYINYGLVTIFLTYAIDATFRGIGDTKTPLKIYAFVLTLNALLDPILIFGIGPFPKLYAGGAALATIIAHAVAFIMGLIILKRKYNFPIIPQKIIGDLLYRISKIGAPIAANGVMFSLSYMLLTRLVTIYGAESLAALGLGHRIEGIAYFACVGFSAAAQTLVGQNLGAQKPQRAEKAVNYSLLYISGLLLVVSAIYFFFAEPIISFFSNDQAVIVEGVKYLKIIAIFELFLGLEIVLEGAFGGSGYSLPPMLVIVPITWLRIPLGILLAQVCGLGSIGIWWAISLTTFLKGSILFFWFKHGSWKKHKI